MLQAVVPLQELRGLGILGLIFKAGSYWRLTRLLAGLCKVRLYMGYLPEGFSGDSARRSPAEGFRVPFKAAWQGRYSRYVGLAGFGRVLGSFHKLL